MQLHLPPPLTSETFLRDYWQKKPLLIRQAFPGFISPLEPEELAGLACDEEFPSRLVIQQSSTEWICRHGPFTESDFSQLPESGYSLLITDIEKHLPEFRAYIEPFRFIPDWRIDDLMISYAPPGGSVGPHTDDYDVFLLQAWGTRRWGISQQPVTEADLLPELDLKILREFTAEQEWLLEPGDMLYLPPGVSHSGVAVDHCMTWSIGFRAPAYRDLLTAYIDDLAPNLDTSRYTDPDLALQQNPGEISSAARQQLRTKLRQLMAQSDTEIDRWLGKFLSEAGCGEFSDPSAVPVNDAQFLQQLQNGGPLQRRAGIRFAYITLEKRTYLYAGGEELECPLKLAKLLCREYEFQPEVIAEHLNQQNLSLLTKLYNFGFVEFADEQ